jgi:hypothetical protein
MLHADGRYKKRERRSIAARSARAYRHVRRVAATNFERSVGVGEDALVVVVTVPFLRVLLNGART